MNVSQVDKLLNSPERMNAVVHAMANFLADVMVIKDEEQAANVLWDHDETFGKTKKQLADMRQAYWNRVGMTDIRCLPFGTLLHQEFAYKADEEKEMYLHNLHSIHEHTVSTMRMCAKMMEESKLDYNQESSDESEDDDDSDIKLSSSEFRNNVDLLYYAFSNAFSSHCSPYFFSAAYKKPNGGLIYVGAIAKGLRDEFERLLLEWLYTCDKTFCSIYGLKCEDSDELDEFISKIATGLSRRQCAMFDPNDKDLKQADIGSQASYLHCKAEAEFVKNCAAAHMQKKHDSEVLNDLLVLAKDGGRTKAGQEVLLLRTSNVLRAMDSPPQELGVQSEKRRKLFNFETLRDGIADTSLENPFRCRCNCATAWSESNGAWVAEQIEHALKLIWREDYKAGIVYLDIVSTKRSPGCVVLPPNPCAFEELQWFAHPPDWKKRTLLTNHGLRLVCIAALVWNKLRSGCFKFGTCQKTILYNISTDFMRQAKYMEAMLQADRLINSYGVKLRMFERNFNDLSSQVSEQLRVPLCNLSGVSIAELHALFATEKGFSMVRDHLSSTTRELVSPSIVPIQYVEFTDDALSIVFETIQMRRQSHGLSIHLKPNAIADMMRCIPKVCNWKPTDGILKLDVHDLKRSHPNLRLFLEHNTTIAAQTGSRFFARRASNRAHAKLEFLFDCFALLELLKL